MAQNPLEHVLDHHEWLGPFSKYQVLLVVAAIAVAVPYILLARRVKDGTPPRGPFWNFLEMLLLFIRDEVARPNIHGGHDHDEPHGVHDAITEQTHAHHGAVAKPHVHFADRYVPFLWTLFLFILGCNLLGMVPFLGSPTAELSVTLVLALAVFFVIHVSALIKLGIGKYVMSYVPRLKGDNLVMTLFLSVLIVPLITVIEVMGAFIRAGVLAIRLFANIFAGHVALGVIMTFALADPIAGGLSPGGTVAAVVMATALSVLELFVAFLQAFVFVLLTSIFLGMQLNPEH
ncbi:atp synthase subunit a : ATP synthase subunit a OS=Planctomyces limnophilus (strain ATCC 43296 / DSM 3776 / IFAM 1008 / 290) GN=atpB PE=3 SV=1: ATP-synt_A [Gemmata massiliana]|uniref:ATP synthase subunit a n=1 Tax=Gemmata massiliana TaxID=1210884 RepID=A0A6P2D5N9_9BACT|nr:F0F1 ATP synthase subunit A [Gemmata massiliana]VTR95414.1 atp synthase subunit a : ATP synthase subunit a OS=Planctomyces limnophilus (strain ATCC 43296 / DSM 3776 / IFAM 1008 / 290) GN=atpB PE=3 SV=1: ATP-synt_A [Gemmata massiliana]